jgi:tetratricopeptide (TPR) repeat protein
MADQETIRQLLEEIMESGKSPEEVCKDHPELLEEVQRRWDELRVVDLQIQNLFPTPSIRSGSGADRKKRPISMSGELPRIPGYEVQSTLGAGGMGIVYKARHLTLNRSVAIKMLIAGVYASPVELERFKREAESIATLCHPNIVQVFDAGEWDGRPYFVMEFMEGGTLAKELAGTPRAAMTAARDVKTLAGAVELAHNAGIVHRDLKPANILLSNDGTLKIADFGIARRSDATSDGTMLTLTGLRLGTPSYMAPEQAAGSKAAFANAVDVYALGAILYEMLTGRPPFRGDTPLETERQVMFDEPVAPIRLNPRTPRDLQTICLKALQKDASRRYPSARELADDLDRFTRCVPILARPVGRTERAYKWVRRHPAAAGLAGTIAVVMIAAIVIGVWLQQIESARRTEVVIRQTGARNVVESSLTVVQQLMRDNRWQEARNILEHASERLTEAESHELSERWQVVSSDLAVASELDRIRRSYPEPNENGYNYQTASRAYRAVFASIGAGLENDAARAAEKIKTSAISDQLVIGLDNAAFVSYVSHELPMVEHMLAIARLVAPDPWSDRVRTLANWTNKAELERLMHDALETGFNHPLQQLVILSVLLSGADAQPNALRLLREAQIRNPSDFWVNLELGNSLDRVGATPEALQYYRAATAINPGNYVIWTTMGSVMRRTGDAVGAIASLERAVSINPQYHTAWNILLLAYGDAELEERMMDALGRAEAANPGVQNFRRLTFRMQSHMAIRKQDWRRSVDVITRDITDMDKEHGDIRYELAAAAVLAGDDAAYSSAAQHVINSDRATGIRGFLVARTLVLKPGPLSRFEIARDAFESEREAFGDQHWALTLQGAIRYRMGDAAGAISLFEQSNIKSSHPGHQIINWAWLALAHAAIGEKDKAREWLAKTQAWIDERGGKMPRTEAEVHPHNWLETLVIMREAKAVLDATP